MYLRAEPGTLLTDENVRQVVEDEYGYGFRSLDTTDAKWESLP